MQVRTTWDFNANADGPQNPYGFNIKDKYYKGIQPTVASLEETLYDDWSQTAAESWVIIPKASTKKTCNDFKSTTQLWCRDLNAHF